MKSVLLFVSLVAAPVCAQETDSKVTAPSNQAANITLSSTAVPATTSVLDSYGVVPSQHLVTALSANLTPAQRIQIDQAVAVRNASLSQANAELVSTLRSVLGETDEGLKSRMMN